MIIQYWIPFYLSPVGWVLIKNIIFFLRVYFNHFFYSTYPFLNLTVKIYLMLANLSHNYYRQI